MSKLWMKWFGGMVPRRGEQHLTDKRLEETGYFRQAPVNPNFEVESGINATEAENCNLYSGELRPLHKPALAHRFCRPGDACWHVPIPDDPSLPPPPPPPEPPFCLPVVITGQPGPPVCTYYGCDALNELFNPYIGLNTFGQWPFLDPTYSNTVPEKFAKTAGVTSGLEFLAFPSGGTYGSPPSGGWESAAITTVDLCDVSPRCVGNYDVSFGSNYTCLLENDAGLWGVKSPSIALATILRSVGRAAVVFSTVNNAYGTGESGSTFGADKRILVRLHNNYSFAPKYSVEIEAPGMGSWVTDLGDDSESLSDKLFIVRIGCSNYNYQLHEDPPPYSKTSWHLKGDVIAEWKLVRLDGSIMAQSSNAVTDVVIAQTFNNVKDASAPLVEENKIQANSGDSFSYMLPDIYTYNLSMNLGIEARDQFGTLIDSGGYPAFPTDEEIIKALQRNHADYIDPNLDCRDPL